MTKHTTRNFFSTYLTNAKVNPLWFGLAYVAALLLYWKSFGGHPVWDDTTYWFFDPHLQSQTYGSIWKYAAWPVAITFQKLLSAIGGYNWWFFHGVNFVLHSFNAWLVYMFLRTIGLKQLVSFVGFLLFLIHPANVITVAWMIQLKTLLSFSFGMGAIVVYLRRKHLDHTVIACVLYLIAVLAKSAILPLPLALTFLSERPLFRKRNLPLVAFFLIAGIGFLQINYSTVALEGVKDALEATGKGIPKKKIQKQEAVEPESFKAQPDEPGIKSQHEFTPSDVTVTPKKLVELSPWAAKRRLFIKTLHYYFWQSYVPVNNVPVKGQNPFPPSLWDYGHLIFLVCLILITAKYYVFYLLAAGHVFLLPYLGLIPAPYMNITWVSDQHLYIALPFFIALFLCLFDRVRYFWKGILIGALLVLYSFKTLEAVKYYKNNVEFYKASINQNYNNIPLVYNLAVIYVAEGRISEATDLLRMVIDLAKNEPYLFDDKYFPYLVHLMAQIESGGIRH